MVACACNPGTQEDCFEFEPTLGYIENSSITWAKNGTLSPKCEKERKEEKKGSEFQLTLVLSPSLAPAQQRNIPAPHPQE